MRKKLLTMTGVIAIFAMTGIASAQSNLLINGDFSLDGLGGTSAAQDALGWTEYHSGGWDNREVNDSWPDVGDYHFAIGNSGGYGAGVYQDVAVVPTNVPTEYVMSCEAMLDAWWNNSLYIKLEFYDAATDTNGVLTNMLGAAESPHVSQPANDVGVAHASYTLQGEAPAGTEIIRVLLGSYGDGGTARFDDASLVYVDPNADNDSDGMPNFWEDLYGLDKDTPDAGGDPDGDALTNINEYLNGTSPQNSDSDGDGLEDGEEVVTYLTDPNDHDSDDDGLSDYDEVTVHLTDPNLVDTDGDGENDDFELFQYTDPTTNTSSSAAFGIPTVDGTLDAAFYGAALAVQTVETSGADALGVSGTNYISGTELDAVYSVTKNGKLYLMVTGNISNTWGKVNIYIDSANGITNNVLDTLGFQGDPVYELPEIEAPNGMTFDAGFTPDYWLVARGSYNDGWDNFYISYLDLAAKEWNQHIQPTVDESINVNYITGTGANTYPIGIALDNSNTNGVVSGTGVADQVAAAAVTTGLEFSIDLLDIGNPTGLVRIAIMAAEEGNAYLINQVLPGVPSPQDDLGTASTFNFSSIAGDQFFVALDASLDTDDDDMPDLWEQSFGLDPNDATGDNGAAGDPDADGLANIDELNNNTNPQNPDSDEDGLTDNEEVNTYSTDPNDWDTDDDGLSDVDEVTVHLTDPNLADSDADGEEDPFELFQGTDPMDAGSSSAALGLAIADGTLDAAYGDALAIQTVNTAWTNNLDELDAAYAVIQNDRLYLMLTGNMNTNWNSVEIFIDSTDAVTTNVFTAQGHDNTDNMNGLVFDEGFSPDYHLNARVGTWEGNTNELGESNFEWNLNYADLGTGAESWQANAFGNEIEGTHLMGTGDANTNSQIAIGFDNSNTAGVEWGDDPANPVNALAVSTGLELSIALADLGNPAGEIRIMAMVTGSNTNTGDHSIMGNQVLAGIGTGPELGATSNVNFSAIAGDQFFTVSIPLAAKAHIMSGQMVSGNTLFELHVSQLVPGIDYHVEETADLGAGFTAVPGSDWTAASANEVKTVPADMGANPVMFYQVVAP